MAEGVPEFLAARRGLGLYHERLVPGMLLGGTNTRFWGYFGQSVPSRPQPLTDVFPELVGYEEELDAIERIGQGELTIPEVCREGAEGQPLIYFDLSVIVAGGSDAGAFVVVQDVSRQSAYHRKLLQSRNENTLLKDRLVQRTARLRETARKLAKARREVAARNEELRRLNDEVRRHSHVLEGEVRKRTHELRESQLEVIRRLAQASESRDPETGQHIQRMSRYAVLLANRVGLGERECDLLLHASPLHDIGKIAVPDAILLKPGALLPDEWEVMKAHTVHGHRLLAGAGSELMAAAASIARAHHEAWDGSGYPDGARGAEIPIFARICGIADCFDALMSDRPYKGAWTADHSWRELEAQAGRRYDPELVRAFRDVRSAVDGIRAQFSDESEFEELASD